MFNVDRHESDHLIGKAEDKIYIEGGSGIKPVVPAAEIQRLVNEEIIKKGGNPATTLISKATIEMPFDFPDDYTTMFRYPKILSPTIKISTNTTVTFAGLTDAKARRTRIRVKSTVRFATTLRTSRITSSRSSGKRPMTASYQTTTSGS